MVIPQLLPTNSVEVVAWNNTINRISKVDQNYEIQLVRANVMV